MPRVRGVKQLLEAEDVGGLIDLSLIRLDGASTANVIFEFREIQSVDRVHFYLLEED